MASEPTTRRLKIIAGADSFGCNLKDSLISHLKSFGIEVHDLGTSSYYSIAHQVASLVSRAQSDPEADTRGLVACGTGVGVAIFANKLPGVYAATCLTTEEALNARSINNSNVLAVSGMNTPYESAVEILDTFLKTDFKAPCPASGSEPWPDEIDSFLSDSVAEMAKIGTIEKGAGIEVDVPCSLCCLMKNRDEKEAEEFQPMEVIPGGSMKIIRETPTSAIVRFKSGSVEPAHHHTFGHDLVVLKGRKSVWNLMKKERYDLGIGDYLFTPAGDVHRVKYHEDTEFFIKWDGHWDILFDEELDVAKAETENEN